MWPVIVSYFLMRLESIKFILSTGCWSRESKSSGAIAHHKPLDRLDGCSVSSVQGGTVMPP
jgi:hypothetical protein